MGLIYINTWCRHCKSDNVIHAYNEKLNDIMCCCMECYSRGILKEFDYEIDGDTKV